MRHEFKTYNFKLITSKRGVASLGAMLLLGSVIVEIGLIGVFLVTLLTNANVGTRLSAEAFAAARSGIDEGILTVLRKKDGFYSMINPALSTGNARTNLTICPNSDFNIALGPGACDASGSAPGRFVVHSIGSALGKERWLVAILEVNQGTGLVRVLSVEEKTR